MNKQKVLVIGGSGFLGSHVADMLSEQSYAVTIFDKIQSPYLKNNQKMLMGDILDKDQLIAACSGHDFIYNFAGLADINDAKCKPELTAKLNILGVINVLEAALAAKSKRVIHASSVYVYSNKGSFYSISKYAAERFIEAYHEQYGLEYTILRYGSLYGRRADDRNGIYRLLHGALKNGQIIYHGSSETLREYIHVRDAAYLSVKVLAEDFKNKNYVLTGNEKMAMRDVLRMIQEILSKKVIIQFVDKAEDFHYEITPYNFQPRLGHKLSTNQHVDMGQGLLDCIQEISSSLATHEYLDELIIDKIEN